jgi:hypothetical protein
MRMVPSPAFVYRCSHPDKEKTKVAPRLVLIPEKFFVYYFDLYLSAVFDASRKQGLNP